MTTITADDYKQAELVIMRRDTERRWRTHAKAFVFGVVVLGLGALLTAHLVAFGIVALLWLAALAIHYSRAIRAFNSSKAEFQGRVEFVAQRRRLEEAAQA